MDYESKVTEDLRQEIVSALEGSELSEDIFETSISMVMALIELEKLAAFKAGYDKATNEAIKIIGGE